MAEKELAFISIGAIIFVFLIFFILLFLALGDKSVIDLNERPSPLLELDEKKDLVYKDSFR
jgi:hypothetical protein|tara:strand:+ start:310 stop:492 length:183 start_codon:yes stop_codon:yes gene_type:complete